MIEPATNSWICEECGDNEAFPGILYCLECLESLDEGGVVGAPCWTVEERGADCR